MLVRFAAAMLHIHMYIFYISILRCRCVHMTMSVMLVSSDIPFESEEEIATRLARYEKLFSNRYTEEDDWYAGTCQRTGRYMYMCSGMIIH